MAPKRKQPTGDDDKELAVVASAQPPPKPGALVVHAKWLGLKEDESFPPYSCDDIARTPESLFPPWRLNWPRRCTISHEGDSLLIECSREYYTAVYRRVLLATKVPSAVGQIVMNQLGLQALWVIRVLYEPSATMDPIIPPVNLASQTWTIPTPAGATEARVFQHAPTTGGWDLAVITADGSMQLSSNIGPRVQFGGPYNSLPTSALTETADGGFLRIVVQRERARRRGPGSEHRVLLTRVRCHTVYKLLATETHYFVCECLSYVDKKASHCATAACLIASAHLPAVKHPLQRPTLMSMIKANAQANLCLFHDKLAGRTQLACPHAAQTLRLLATETKFDGSADACRHFLPEGEEGPYCDEGDRVHINLYGLGSTEKRWRAQLAAWKEDQENPTKRLALPSPSAE